MGTKFFWGLIIIIFVAAGLGGFFLFKQKSSKINVLPEFKKSPDFQLQDYQGKEIKLRNFREKNVIVNSWATWCPFCKEELKDLAAVQKEFGDQIVIIAVGRAESLEVAKKYTDNLGVNGSLIFLLDPADSFYQSIGGFSMPETIFIDKNGFIRAHKRGPMNLEEIRRKIQQAFNI